MPLPLLAATALLAPLVATAGPGSGSSAWTVIHAADCVAASEISRRAGTNVSALQTLCELRDDCVAFTMGTGAQPSTRQTLVPAGCALLT